MYHNGWYFPFQRVNGYRITSKMYCSKYRFILDCIGLTGGYQSFRPENLNHAGIDLWLSVTPPSPEALTLPAVCHPSFSLALSLLDLSITVQSKSQSDPLFLIFPSHTSSFCFFLVRRYSPQPNPRELLKAHFISNFYFFDFSINLCSFSSAYAICQLHSHSFTCFHFKKEKKNLWTLISIDISYFY